MESVQDTMFDKIISLFKKIFMKPKMLGEGIVKEDNTKFDKRDLKKISFDVFANVDLEPMQTRAMANYDYETSMKRRLSEIRKDKALLVDISTEELREVNEYFDTIIDVL